MTFEAKLTTKKQLSEFTLIIETATKIDKDAILEFTTTGIQIKACDPLFVAMINIDFPPEFFTKYNPPQEPTYIITKINLDDLKKILLTNKKNDPITLSYQEDLKQLSINIGKSKRKYILGSLAYDTDKESTDMEIQSFIEQMGEMTYDYSIQLKPNSLKEIIPQMSLFADQVNITIDSHEGTIKLTSESEIRQKTEMNLEVGDEYVESMSAEDNADDWSMDYYIKNLDSLIKISSISGKIFMLAESSKPTLFTFTPSPKQKTHHPWRVEIMIVHIIPEDNENDPENSDE